MRNEISALGLTASLSILSGCMFSGLKEDVTELDAAATINGTVRSLTSGNKPVLIALFRRGDDRGLTIDRYALRYGPGTFKMVLEQGAVLLGAFEDINNDLILQSNERVGWYGKPTPLRVRAGTSYSEIDIDLRSPEQARRELPEIYAAGAPRITLRQDRYPLGEITSFDDTRFTAETGKAGLWEPLKFFRQRNGGVFFLKPYDPQKIPVLFVHGIGGNAGEWRYIVDRLDTDRFQPWLAQYPSGVRLGMASDWLEQALLELKVRHQFDDLILVAHSMGGLLARGFINRTEQAGQSDMVKLFVTLSTPWAGHASAKMGVDLAPVPVPVWNDMVPDSDFLRALFATPLSPQTQYYLLFSHRGKFDIVTKHNSDGAVSLASQLLATAQRESIRTIGFDEDHSSILRSDDVAAELNGLIALRAKQLRPAEALAQDSGR